MKTKIYRIVYFAFTTLFYYVFLGGYFTIDLSEHTQAASHIAPLASALMPLIAIFFTPFIMGWGFFLFFKYPKQKKWDFVHYSLIYPGFAIFIITFGFFIKL